MSIIIITAIIAFDCGMAFGAWWATREKDYPDYTYDKDTIDKKISRHIMENGL